MMSLHLSIVYIFNGRYRKSDIMYYELCKRRLNMARDRVCVVQFIAVAVCLWTLQIQVQSVMADYVLEIKVTTYSNPTSRCATCFIRDYGIFRCCDGDSTTDCTGGDQCDNQFYYCLRPHNTSLTTRGCTGYEHTVRSGVNLDDAPIDFSQSTVLGLSNPMNLTGLDTFWKGVQLYIRVRDYDSGYIYYNDFVDSFSINMNENTTKGSYLTLLDKSGTYNFATIGVTARFLCAENYTGELCERFDNCSAHQINCSEHEVCNNGEHGSTCDWRVGGSNGGITGGVVGGLVAVILTVLLLILLVVLVIVAIRKRQVQVTQGIIQAPPPPYTPGDNPVYGAQDTVVIKHSDKSNTAEFDNPVYDIEGPEYETPITTRQPTTYETISPLYSTVTDEHTEQSTHKYVSDTVSNNPIYGNDIEGPEYATPNTTRQPTAYEVPTSLYSTVTDDV